LGLGVKEGAVAQSVEQRTENPCVGGSIPPHTTKKSSDYEVKFIVAFSLVTTTAFFLSIDKKDKLVRQHEQQARSFF
jgi:hypothetical protein